MSTVTIEITFDESGQPTIEVKGVKGPACLQLTSDLEKALGLVVEETKKQEFYQQPETTANRLRVGGK